MSSPSIQCEVCGRWTRLFGFDEDGYAIQRIYPDSTGKHWCKRCTESKPKEYEEASDPPIHTDPDTIETIVTYNVTKVGNKLFVVNGLNSIKTLDGTVIKVNPDTREER